MIEGGLLIIALLAWFWYEHLGEGADNAWRDSRYRHRYYDDAEDEENRKGWTRK